MQDTGKFQTGNTDQRERQLQLAWLTAKTLVHIDTTLSDLQTLVQHQVDLLRRLLERTALP